MARALYVSVAWPRTCRSARTLAILGIERVCLPDSDISKRNPLPIDLETGVQNGPGAAPNVDPPGLVNEPPGVWLRPELVEGYLALRPAFFFIDSRKR